MNLKQIEEYFMKLRNVFFVLGTATILLSGCSGSSTSGVGAPSSTPYAGTYDGVLNITLRGSGASVSDSMNYRVTVGVDGEVTENFPGFSGSGTCDDDGTRYYLTGNVLEVSENLSCAFPNLGKCNVQGDTRYVFNAAAGSLSGSAKYFCEAGNITATVSGYLPKTS